MTDTATINLPGATSVDEVLCNKTSDGVNDVVRIPVDDFANQLLSDFSGKVPEIAANRMLVDNAAGDARETKTFSEVRALLQTPAEEMPEAEGSVGTADDSAVVQSAVDAAGVSGLPAILSRKHSLTGLALNYKNVTLSGGGANTGVVAATGETGPLIKSLLADRIVAGSTEGLVLKDLSLDGDDTATIGIQLERFTRRCGLSNVYVTGVDGDGIDITASWSWWMNGVQAYANAGHGLNANEDQGEVNAFCITGSWFGANGGAGAVFEDAQAGAIIGSTFEYNYDENLNIAGRALFMAGVYLEGHSTDAYPKGQEYCAVFGNATNALLDGFFWGYQNGGSSGANSFDGDGGLLANVIGCYFKVTFSQSTRYELVYNETGTCIDNDFWLTADAHTGVTTSALIRNETSGTSSDATVLKGANCYNNTSRYAGSNLGLRYAYQIKPTGTTGSIFEQRIAWGGNGEIRWGKLSSAINGFSLVVNGATRLHAETGIFRALDAYTATTANAANVHVASDGQLLRSTSGDVYKHSQEKADTGLASDTIMALEPIWYRSRCDADNPNWSWWSFSADATGKVDPRLVNWKTHEVVREYVDVEVQPERYDTETGLLKAAEVESQLKETLVPLEHPEAEDINLKGVVALLTAHVQELTRQLAEISEELKTSRT